jgi:hypothetical protein
MMKRYVGIDWLRWFATTLHCRCLRLRQQLIVCQCVRTCLKMKVNMSATYCQRIDTVRQVKSNRGRRLPEGEVCLHFETWKAVTTQTCLPSLFATQFARHVFNHSYRLSRASHQNTIAPQPWPTSHNGVSGYHLQDRAR